MDMDWKKFITPICESKITSDVSHKILHSLFDIAGCKNDFSESAAKSWFSGERKCKVNIYFPDKSINLEKVFRFFRGRPDSKLRHLQQMFKKKKVHDFGSPINVDTNDLDTFCWSLVNQFLDLLGFQRVDIPCVEHSIPESPPSVGGSNVSKEGKRPIKFDFLPHSGVDCCYQCDFWEGDRTCRQTYYNATYGVCRMYNRREQLSSSSACKHYKKYEPSLEDYEFWSSFLNKLK